MSPSSFRDVGCDNELLLERLYAVNYVDPLPVQSTVIPTVLKALRSGLPLDVCLSAPTGSGKTLCFLLPALLAIIDEKKKMMSQSPAGEEDKEKNELPFGIKYNRDDTQHRCFIVVPTKALAQQVYDLAVKLTTPQGAAESDMPASPLGARKKKQKTEATEVAEANADDNGALSDSNGAEPASISRPSGSAAPLSGAMEYLSSLVRVALADSDSPLSRAVTLSDGVERRYATADLVVGTPQKIFKYITGDQHATLRHMRFFVLDEADDVLSGTFTSYAGRIATLLAHNVEAGHIHRMLCSATLTSRITNVSDIPMQNSRHFSLDTSGEDLVVPDEEEQLSALAAEPTGPAGKKGGKKASKAEAVTATIVRNQFSLPPTLFENFVIVRKNAERHAVLLNVLKHVDEHTHQLTPASQAHGAAAAPAAAHPSLGTVIPQSILVFCSSSDTARVLSHFLTHSGYKTLEFTGAATEQERKQAVMKAFAGDRYIVIATDAMMRGIDLPGVKAVVMYDPPRSLQQYVHRVGRTARARAVGSSYILLTRDANTGADGEAQGSEVSDFRQFDPFLRRTRKADNVVTLREVSEQQLSKANEMLGKAQQSIEDMQSKGGDSKRHNNSSHMSKRPFQKRERK